MSPHNFPKEKLVKATNTYVKTYINKYTFSPDKKKNLFCSDDLVLRNSVCD